MFSKILIANRGEIAVRIIRACKEMGISTVAVYSLADQYALHASLADESVCIGKDFASNSYLNMEAIISAAKATKAGAIHPGYGLLSENATFSKLCEKNDIVFIGPSSDVINKAGSKDIAIKTMKEAGLPIITGSDICTSLEDAISSAEKIGFPLLIKARNSGGGKGIRHVENKKDFKSAYINATREAQASFLDGAVYLEKYLSPVKHIEMQILADNHNNVLCLGERECTIQRNKQKMIEESPSMSISKETRAKMIECSIKAARALNYVNAGTIEYLLDKDGNFYFMEMNTRLQVEHPVTEMVSGIDIVKWQIRIAEGVELPYKQEDITLSAYAIECRINAENPRKNYAPSCGKIKLFHQPGGPWVRFDTALYTDYVVPPYYDSLIGKLIVSAKTREEAIRKMQAALCELVIEGIEHNADIQHAILSDENFKSGNYYTDFMESFKY